jgi:hypothetical protein
MNTSSRFTTIAASFLALLAFTGCPTKDSMPELDAGTDSVSTPDPGADSGAAGGAGGGAAPSDPGKPLAYGCAADSECASGFCVDGVCCDARCDQQCAECNAPGGAGHCTPQIAGDDTQAAVACTGAHTCGLTGCKLRNKQACSQAVDCASLNCATFYEDLDQDGYGSANTLKLCEDAGAAAPGGYSTLGGDCCDQDLYTNPGQTSYFSTTNACGSWDYNCDGTIEGAFHCDGYNTPGVCGSKPPAGGPSCVGSHPDATHCH